VQEFLENRLRFRKTARNPQNYSLDSNHQARRDSIARISYDNVAAWVAGWVSVTAGINLSKRLNLS